MKAAIIYSTMTGHSKKIALAMSQELGVPAHDIKANPKLESCDLLFIISGIYGGESSQELLEFAKKLDKADVPSAALITSSTRAIQQGSLKDLLTNNGVTVKEEPYNCLGGFLLAKFAHPTKDDIAGAIAYAKKLVMEEVK